VNETVPGASRLFGSSRRTSVLILIASLTETYPRELARLLGAPLVSVQRIIDGLQLEGVVSSVVVGRQRRVSLNPRWFAANQLRALLLRLAEGDPRYDALAASLRRRPRRSGKPL
jgi:hypothetical protein